MNAESVNSILTRKGITATIRTYPNATFGPSTNTTTRGAATDYLIKIIPPYRYLKESYKQTTLITYGKGITGLANHELEFTVKVGLIIVINSKEWTVTGVTPIQDNSGIIMYILEIES